MKACLIPKCAGLPGGRWEFCYSHWDRLPTQFKLALARAFRRGQYTGFAEPSAQYKEILAGCVSYLQGELQKALRSES